VNPYEAKAHHLSPLLRIDVSRGQKGKRRAEKARSHQTKINTVPKDQKANTNVTTRDERSTNLPNVARNCREKMKEIHPQATKSRHRAKE